jgi:hypothetical protein
MQVTIAKDLKESKQWVNKQVKFFRSVNLIKPYENPNKKEGTRGYTLFYELSPEAKKIVQGIQVQPLSACRVHNIRKRYAIIKQTAPISIEPRTGWIKTNKKFRGGEINKYWFSGKAGSPSITLDIYPKTIIAYPDKGQTIPAESIEQQIDITYTAMYGAIQEFIWRQKQFGVLIEVDMGKQVTKTHHGFPVDEKIIPEKRTEIKGTFVDQSITELPGKVEWEMTNPARATAADKAILKIVTIDDTLKKMLDPLHQDVDKITAHITAGTTQNIHNQQVIGALIKVFDEMAEMRKELRDLKAGK